MCFSQKSIYTGICLLFVLQAVNSHAQNIGTIAGTGVAGFIGDDGPAIENQLWAPAAVAVNKSGFVYIADGLNNRIRVVSPAGTICTIAGVDDPGNGGDGGPATRAHLNNPSGIAVDNHGNVYISDKYNNRVRKIDSKGIITAFAGASLQGYSGDNGPAIESQLNSPTGLATDTSGNVYIADAGNHCIRKVTPDGRITTFAGTGTAGFSGDKGPASAAMLNSPNGMAIDTSGNLLIADSWNYRIRKVDPAGNITTIAGIGSAGFSGDGGMDTSAEFNLPTSIAVDRMGNIFIADQGNNRIREIAGNGVITTFAGNGNAAYSGDGGPASKCELNAPPSIAINGNNLYIAELPDNRVRMAVIPPAPKVVKTTHKNTAGANTAANAPSTPSTQSRTNTANTFPALNQMPAPNPPAQTGMYNRRRGG